MVYLIGEMGDRSILTKLLQGPLKEWSGGPEDPCTLRFNPAKRPKIAVVVSEVGGTDHTMGSRFLTAAVRIREKWRHRARDASTAGTERQGQRPLIVGE